MNYEKIYSVLHIGKNLLIVGFNQSDKWQFRAVTKEGEIVKEVANFNTPEEAEKTGKSWIESNLPLD